MESSGWLERIAEARIGVFAWVRGDGTPGSCPVTPFVVGDEVVVTSTLAYTAKAAAVRRDPRVAVLAGQVLVHGRAEVLVDESPRWFDEHLREDEVRKFPPTRSILAVPGHRCLFPWYVGRIVIRFRPEAVESVDGGDAVTATRLTDDGRLRIDPVAVDASGAPDLRALPDGPVAVLFHEEHRDMADLRQLSVRGVVRGGGFVEDRRTGSMEPAPTGTVAQITQLRALARSAKRNRDTIRSWGAA